MRLGTFLLLVLCGSVVPVKGQNVQWASGVEACTLPNGEGGFSVTQVLGKPNVLPAYNHSLCAWMIADRDARGKFIKPKYAVSLTVGFALPMQAQQVAVAESYNPGSIERITLIDSADTKHVVYSAKPRPTGLAGRMLNVFFPMTEYRVHEVMIEFLPENLRGISEIDAIGISDDADSVRASIHVAENIPFVGEAENLGTGVNTQYSEFLPVVSPDNNALYFIRNNDIANVGGQTLEGNADIWYSMRGDNDSWTPARNIGPPLNNEAANAIFSISPDGNMMLLKGRYSVNGKWDGKGFSLTRILENGWTSPEPMDIENYYNKNEYSEAYLCPDNCTLLMTIERADSYGEKDIYVSFCRSDGTWSEPQNLGPRVNTAGSETSPFLARDGVTLYYATDGRSGYGGLDIFVTRRLDSTWTQWSEPENLGPLINTPGFDGYFMIAPAGDYAYFSREVGDNGNNDLFRIALPSTVHAPRSTTITSMSNADNPASGKFTAFQKLPGGMEKNVERIKHLAVRPGKMLAAVVPPAEPHDTVIVPPILKALAVQAVMKAFPDTTTPVKFKVLDPVLTDPTSPYAPNSRFYLNHITFEFADAKLNPINYAELDSVAMVLQAHPEISIIVNGFTDNVGSDERNYLLSVSRAEVVGKYLVHKGVNEVRIQLRGWGKAHPMAENNSDEGRKKNRRVEFTILHE